jgi:hypothetical protein
MIDRGMLKESEERDRRGGMKVGTENTVCAK